MFCGITSENEEIMCGGNTLQMGQLVNPKLILGPLHREVNTALFIGHFELCFKLLHNVDNNVDKQSKQCKTCSSVDGKHVHSRAVWRVLGRATP